eukprot:3045079-Pyramimonas_sp.AAC.1
MSGIVGDLEFIVELYPSLSYADLYQLVTTTTTTTNNMLTYVGESTCCKSLERTYASKSLESTL